MKSFHIKCCLWFDAASDTLFQLFLHIKLQNGKSIVFLKMQGVSIQHTIFFIFMISIYDSEFNISYKYSKIHEQILNFKFILYSLYISQQFTYYGNGRIGLSYA